MNIVHKNSQATGEPTIKAVHLYIAPMMFKGRRVDVKLTVKETTGPKEPNPLCTIEAGRVEPASVSKTSAPGRNRNGAPAGSKPYIAKKKD